MKKILVTFQVKDVGVWLSNNTLRQIGKRLGIKFDLFINRRSKLVGYVAEIPDATSLDEILINTTILSDSFKTDGLKIENIEILESLDV